MFVAITLASPAHAPRKALLCTLAHPSPLALPRAF